MNKRAAVLLSLVIVTCGVAALQAYNVEWRSFLGWENAAHWSGFPIRYIIRSEHISQS